VYLSDTYIECRKVAIYHMGEVQVSTAFMGEFFPGSGPTREGWDIEKGESIAGLMQRTAAEATEQDLGDVNESGDGIIDNEKMKSGEIGFGESENNGVTVGESESASDDSGVDVFGVRNPKNRKAVGAAAAKKPKKKVFVFRMKDGCTGEIFPIYKHDIEGLHAQNWPTLLWGRNILQKLRFTTLYLAKAYTIVGFDEPAARAVNLNEIL
jgi:hypothetical protein